MRLGKECEAPAGESCAADPEVTWLNDAVIVALRSAYLKSTVPLLSSTPKDKNQTGIFRIHLLTSISPSL